MCCGEHGATARLTLGMLPCQPVACLEGKGVGAVLELMGKPLTLVMRAMTNAGNASSVADAGWHALHPAVDGIDVASVGYDA